MQISSEELGRCVREAWVKWALTQPNPKPSWLVPYDELSEADKEADIAIGWAVFWLAHSRIAPDPLGQLMAGLKKPNAPTP